MKLSRTASLLAALALGLAPALPAADDTLDLTLRKFDQGKRAQTRESWNAAETAAVICDMRDIPTKVVIAIAEPGYHTATFSAAPGAAGHPILEGIDLPFTSGGGIYFSTTFADSTRLVLIAALEGHEPEPVAWTNLFGPKKAKIFYTSLGQEEEFASPSYQKLLWNAMEWLRLLPDNVPNEKGY